MIDRISISTLNFSKEIQDKLDAEGIILIKEDDLSCMEDDYKEACDRLMTIRQLAKEGLAVTDIEKKNAFGIDNVVMAHNKFDEILTEVES